MALFQQKPEEQLKDWAGLPSEPRDEIDGIDTLSAPPADPLGLGLGASISSIAFAVPVPADPQEVPVEDD